LTKQAIELNIFWGYCDDKTKNLASYIIYARQ
jgi:hypothetical protein